MIIIAGILTILIGVIGSAIGFEINFDSLGPVLAIAVMGSFILLEVKKVDKD